MKERTDIEFANRQDKVRALMRQENLDAVLVCTNANVYYLAGRVFYGFVYIAAGGQTLYFVQRPVTAEGDNVVHIRKPEQIADELKARGVDLPKRIGFELEGISYLEAMRYAKAFGDAEMANCSAILSQARAVKTDFEIERLRESGMRHCGSYRRIQGLYHEGMTDVELQIEIERVLRLDGCLGIFRIAGRSMELFMGNLLAGDNADVPSPYDFAMGGEGLDSSLPVGCSGSIIHTGNTVMIDMNGNFTGYMTDMTRTFYVGRLDAHAEKAHQLSIDIHKALRTFMRPGVAAKDVYEKAAEMVRKAGEDAFFMGHRQHAGFVGHGVGIEVNEWPVLAPKSRHVLEAGNVVAIEPKFVIPGIGAVGVENTYVVTGNGLECLTPFPEEITELL